mgnify:CR=1 FL=1
MRRIILSCIAAVCAFSAQAQYVTYNHSETKLNQVTVMEKKGDWFRVTAPDGAVGWMHAGALTKSKIRLSAGESDAQTGASSDELALAGKGFNADVEAQFKQQNQKIDFTWVDRMEKIKVSAKESQDFLKAGGLAPEQGGAP